MKLRAIAAVEINVAVINPGVEDEEVVAAVAAQTIMISNHKLQTEAVEVATITEAVISNKIKTETSEEVVEEATTASIISSSAATKIPSSRNISQTTATRDSGPTLQESRHLSNKTTIKSSSRSSSIINSSIMQKMTRATTGRQTTARRPITEMRLTTMKTITVSRFREASLSTTRVNFSSQSTAFRFDQNPYLRSTTGARTQTTTCPMTSKRPSTKRGKSSKPMQIKVAIVRSPAQSHRRKVVATPITTKEIRNKVVKAAIATLDSSSSRISTSSTMSTTNSAATTTIMIAASSSSRPSSIRSTSSETITIKSNRIKIRIAEIRMPLPVQISSRNNKIIAAETSTKIIEIVTKAEMIIAMPSL